VVETLLPYTGSFKGGVNLAAGQITGAGGGGFEVFVAPATGKGRLLIFTDSDANGLVGEDPLFESFFAFGSKWAKGVRPAAGDTDHSGFFVELVTAPGASTNKRKARILDDNASDVDDKIGNNGSTQEFKLMPGSVKGAGTWVAFAGVFSAVYQFPGSPQGILDTSTLTSEFSVPASAGKIRDLDVVLNIAHSFDGDLDVSLTHVASGTSLVLFNDVGGSNEGFMIRLNDEAGTDIGTASNPKLDGAITGTFNPQGAGLLSVFDNQDASGLWRLTVTDDSGGDTGALMSWGLIVTN
jgi:subtilisin-like proprotein convertase family protein